MVGLDGSLTLFNPLVPCADWCLALEERQKIAMVFCVGALLALLVFAGPGAVDAHQQRHLQPLRQEEENNVQGVGGRKGPTTGELNSAVRGAFDSKSTFLI